MSAELTHLPEFPAPGRAITRDQVARLADAVPLAAGYRFELLQRDDIPALARSVRDWFPEISVGGASQYVSEDFYRQHALSEGDPIGDHIVLVLRSCSALAGMFACEIDPETQSVYAAVGVAAPKHRGANLAYAGISFTEELGRLAGMGFAFGMATLKHQFAQLAFERAGWRLVGITPGYDREMVEPAVVKRVYEALYAKVLVADAHLLHPLRHNLTPRTQAFFDRVFGLAEG
jgi:hypothetical protein